MKRTQKRLAILVFTCIAALVLSACSGTAAATGGIKGDSLKGVKLAFAVSTAAASVDVSQANIFVKQAEKLGATVHIYDNNSDAATMLSNASLMAAAKPDVIVEYPSAANATDRVGQTFTAAGIPCIAINVPVKGCSFFNFDQPALAALGAETIAAKMKEKGWDGTNTTVVIGQASQLGASVNIAVTSFYAKLSELVPGMTKVAASDIGPSTTKINSQGLQVDTGITLDGGFSAVQTALQTIPADRNVVVYSVADDSTQGAIRALTAQNRQSRAMVSGYGGADTSLSAIRAGGIWVSDQVGFFPYWGEFLLAMAVAMHNGVTPPALTAPSQVVITKDNIDKYFKPGTSEVTMMPAIPKESEYLLKTGILQKFGNIQGATS
ncbi:MAG: sugar transporter substrate-binding protein [Microbacteriaceae bacterium]|jgi:ribose transport system substrate-binding protein|nr:sugar transporter substrate-binding protein [Microbacteriaceae bacterium]